MSAAGQAFFILYSRDRSLVFSLLRSYKHMTRFESGT